MRKNLQRISLIVLVLLSVSIKMIAQPTPQVTGPIGSQLSISPNGDISYWNGSSWIIVPPGLPGQQLQFNNGLAAWITAPDGVTTNAITSINETSAVSGGNIKSSGGSAITDRGICWAKTVNPTLANSFTVDGSGKGSFTSSMTGLSSGTQYFVRAYATNAIGTTYGPQISFTTSGAYYTPDGVYFDVDGNTYVGIDIGTQTWMKQNLRTTHYSNGAPITESNNWQQWNGLNTNAAEGYCDYNGQPAFSAAPYGRLYNFYAVTNLNGLCPLGWHVPSEADWNTLLDFLGGNNIYGQNAVAIKLKETGVDHWCNCNGNGVGLYATNETGFSAVAAGFRVPTGNFFFDYSYGGYFWSSTETSQGSAWSWQVYWNSPEFVNNNSNKGSGNSVRCLKNP